MSDSPPEVEGTDSTEQADERAAQTPRPRLQSVKEGAAPARVSAAEERKGGRGLVWLLGLALLVCVVLMVMQARENSALEARVDALDAELAVAGEALSSAEATITRFELRMDEVRGSVGDLLARMATLQELVDRDPKADAAGAPAE